MLTILLQTEHSFFVQQLQWCKPHNRVSMSMYVIMWRRMGAKERERVRMCVHVSVCMCKHMCRCMWLLCARPLTTHNQSGKCTHCHLPCQQDIGVHYQPNRYYWQHATCLTGDNATVRKVYTLTARHDSVTRTTATSHRQDRPVKSDLSDTHSLHYDILTLTAKSSCKQTNLLVHRPH